MIEKNVKCRVITPMFSRSLELENERENIYKFELRPQSVKGVLHFWFRAVVPRVIDIYNLDLNKLPPELRREYENEEYKGLKYVENLLFGSQNNKAPFSLLVDWKESDTQTIGRVVQDRGRNNFLFSNDLGKDASYPLYGLYDYDRRTGATKLINKYLKPGAEFTITVFAKDEPTWDVVFSLIKLISVLSGFGSKTTKGFGEFEIIAPKVERNSYLTEENVKRLISETERSIINFINSKDTNKALILDKSDKVLFPSLVEGKYTFFSINKTADKFGDLMTALYGMMTARVNDRIVVKSRGWYRDLKYRMRKYGNNKTKDCVKELIRCIERKERQADIAPAIIALPLQYQNLKVSNGPNKITIFPKNAIGEKGRKPATLRIIIANQQGRYKPYGLLIVSKISEDNQLIHDLSGFNLTYSAKFSDILREAQNIK